MDTYAQWGAAFRFSVSANGDYFADAITAQRVLGLGWDALVEGGTRGQGWTTPWRPPDEGWNGEPFLLMGSTGQDVEDDQEQVLSLDATYGFVSPRVETLRVEQNGAQRSVEISSAVGAFVVVTVGTEPAAISALDATGHVLGTFQRDSN